MQKFRDVLSRWEAGELSMMEAGELLGMPERQSNNSGIGHLGAACGVPTLTISSGSLQTTEWGPRGDNASAITALVPRAPCRCHRLGQCPNDHLCMKQIAPETVADKAFAMLEHRP